MTSKEKRERLYAYCECRHCARCIVDKNFPTHTCGRGNQFLTKRPDGSYTMSDEEVNEAYRIVFESESEQYPCCTCRYFGPQYDDTECVGCKNHTPWSSPEYVTAPIKWTPAINDPAPSEEDLVNHPNHYTSGGIECIDAIKASMTPIEYAGFLKGQVLKYVWRYRLKGKPVQDLKKARFYLDRLIQETEKEEVAV